ncbi:MAG: HAD hydrolase-like protein [Clostridia bacterium]
MRTEGKGDNQKIVFVDCFNTIIGRTKTPNDVLYDWGLEMNKKFNKCSAINFFKLFKRSWRNLKRFDVIEKENSEFLMDIKSIFNEVFEDFKKITEENISENEFIDIAYDTYFMAEHGSHFLKQKTVKYLYAKKQQGCKIFLVSDFYCDKEEIVKWLEKLGLDCSYIFDDVFVSCDLKKSKKTGSIYHEIIDIKKLNHKNITMVGDNFWSDGIMARKAGLKTKSVFSMFRQDCKILRRSKMPIEVPKEYMDIFNNNISDTTYSNYAFLLFLFAKRLAQSCERKGIKNLFFLARDGKFLKTIFDYYCFSNNIGIATHYLFVSRKSVINTSSQDYDKSFAGLSATPFMTCPNFLKSLSFDNDEIKSIMQDAKITYKGPHLKFNKSRAYRLLLNSKQFEIRYQKIRTEQRASYTNYLNSFNVDIYHEGFYVVKGIIDNS